MMGQAARPALVATALLGLCGWVGRGPRAPLEAALLSAAAGSGAEDLARKLADLQRKVVGGESFRRSSGDAFDDGGQPAEDLDKILARREKRHRDMEDRLRERKRQTEEAEAARRAAEEEKEAIEENLKAVESQATQRERQITRRRKRAERKLLDAQQEIEDLTAEFQREREAHLDALREANREAQLWRQVSELVLPPKEVARVWQRSTYEEDLEKWQLPQLLKPKRDYQNLQCPPLPTLGGGGAFAPAKGGAAAALFDGGGAFDDEVLDTGRSETPGLPLGSARDVDYGERPSSRPGSRPSTKDRERERKREERRAARRDAKRREREERRASKGAGADDADAGLPPTWDQGFEPKPEKQRRSKKEPSLAAAREGNFDVSF